MLKKLPPGSHVSLPGTKRTCSFGWIMIGIAGRRRPDIRDHLFHFRDASLLIAVVAATVMIVLAFFFAAVSGYLVGIMGSSATTRSAGSPLPHWSSPR
ncbi:MAG: hypothetical protein MZV64_71825 [Ignavibacteriales bacterium]|nr:hypothetical protein [Ignavibacteriales bacterium]